MRTCAYSHGRFVTSRLSHLGLSALLLQQPSLVHLASSTFITQRQSSKKKYFSYLGIKSNLRSATDMDDQDLSVLDSRLPFEQMLTATPHRYIHLKGNLVPAFVDNKTHLSFLDISVEFIKERPTSDIELVFKDGAGDKQQSKKFRKSVPIYWSLNMSVHAISIIILRY